MPDVRTVNGSCYQQLQLLLFFFSFDEFVLNLCIRTEGVKEEKNENRRLMLKVKPLLVYLEMQLVDLVIDSKKR